MDLTCPISLDIFEDPISTPCCGNAFSRRPLQNYLRNHSDCPLCRTDIRRSFPEFNVSAVPTNRTIASLVESFRKSTNGQSDVNASEQAEEAGQPVTQPMGVEKAQVPVWSCDITEVFSKSGSRLPVDRLQVHADWPSYEGEVCMFLPVIDQSGSMAGKPFQQVKEALMHMLHQTMAHRSVFTCIIPYSSSASSIRVPRDGSAETERWTAVQQRIGSMRTGGGTSFMNAFKEIKNVIFGDESGGRVRAQAFPVGTPEYEEQRRLGRQGLLVQGAPAFVTSISIVFMTDGQDNSRLRKGSSLVKELQDILKEWKKEVVVHTVGFSRDHDFEMLDQLRKVGTKEGMFRYADPSDGDDALCSKLSELTDSVIAMGGSVPIQLHLPSGCKELERRTEISSSAEEIPNDALTKTIMMENGRGTTSVFLHANKHNSLIGQELTLIIPEAQCPTTTFQVAIAENANLDSSTMNSTLEEWETLLCEEVAKEALMLGSKYTKAQAVGKDSMELGSDFYLHAALLLQRAQCLEAHVKLIADKTIQARLDLCIGQISNMLQGKGANAARLNDAGFSNHTPKLPTVTPPPPPAPIKACGYSQLGTTRGYAGYGNPTSSLTGLYCKHGKGVLGGKKNLTILHRLVLNGSTASIQKRLEESPEEVLAMDEDGNSPLSYAAYVGKMKALQVILKNESSRLMLANMNKKGYCPFELAAARGYWKSAGMIHAVGGSAHLANSMELLETVLNHGYFETAALIAGCGVGGCVIDMLKGKVPSSMLEKAILKSVESQLENATLHQKSSSLGKVSQNWGNGYLKRACENGLHDLVSKCIDQGIIPQTEDELKELLALCGSHGDQGCKIADCLLACYQASNKNVELNLGELVYNCASSGFAQLLEVFLKRSPQDVNYKHPQHNATPLISACGARKMECIMLLLRSSADVSAMDVNNTSAIMASIQRNHCAAVASLLNAGAPLTYINSSKIVFNILFQCCENERPEILDIILKHCDKCMSQEAKRNLLHELNADGLPVLFVAVKHNDSDCIKVLNSHGADLTLNCAQVGGNALHYSVSLKQLSSTLTLLESGVDVNLTDAMGRTALHLAVMKSSLSLVRMLRSFGIDIFVKDASGKTAATYIKALPISEESENLATELLDPALVPLLNAARCLDNQRVKRNCDVIQSYTGIPGYLSGSRCLDIHGGDGWTPLLEAICVGNLAFASALVHSGADLLKCDERGLNGLFWAKALHGEAVANSLVENHSSHSRKEAISPMSSGSLCVEGYSLVTCKDGQLAVSTVALDWMKQNFPLNAVQAFNKDTLKLALTAQGFKVYNSVDEEWVALVEKSASQIEPEFQGDKPLTLDDRTKQALFKLSQSVESSASGKEILYASYHQNISSKTACAFSEHFHVADRMKCNGDIPTFKSLEEPMVKELLDKMSTASPCTSVLAFLHDVSDSRSRWPERAETMARIISHARMIAIGAISGDGDSLSAGLSSTKTSSTPWHLTLSDAFILATFCEGSIMFSKINKCLLANDNAQLSYWENLIASFLHAYHKLSVVRDTVYTVVSPDFLDLVSFNPSKPLIQWNGFLSTTRDWTKLFDDSTLSPVSVVLAIKSQSGRHTSMYSSSSSNEEVLFLPQTCFRLVTMFTYDSMSELEHPSRRASTCGIVADAVAAVKNDGKRVILELEEC